MKNEAKIRPYFSLSRSYYPNVFHHFILPFSTKQCTLHCTVPTFGW